MSDLDDKESPPDGNDLPVTLPEWLEEEKQLEEDAFAVLAASDEKDCTYLRGYVPRQALYACKTCRGSDGEPFGVCLACSYACHENHELYELYTKRSFRCDCGNSKVASPCNLCPKKSATNPYNKYNHNFSGLYCTCNRPYPDPENDDEMYQCVACEDWFHGKHLNCAIPEDDGFAEMVCGHCMEKLSFLWYYHKQNENGIVAESKKDQEKPLSQNSISSDGGAVANSQETLDKASSSNMAGADEGEVEVEAIASSLDVAVDSGIESSCDSLVATTSAECKLKKFIRLHILDNCKGATFWNEGWRSTLCKCSQCQQKYVLLDCAFVCDEEDTVLHYEKQGKEKSIQISQYERGLSEINKLDRVKSLEAIHEYNFMTGELKNYLKKFAENKKIVRAEDIQEFFEDLQARKRPRFELYNCS